MAGFSAGSAFVDLIPRLEKGWDSRVDREVDGPVRKIAGRFQSMGANIARGLALGIAGAAGLGAVALHSTLGAASDLNEATNVTGLIFGENRKAIDEFVKSSYRLGLSETKARELSGSIGGLLQNLGLSADETVNWSTKLLTLGADMGSAFNAEPAEAVEAIGAALRGETEPIRRFNVVLNDAAIKAEAVRLGLAKEGEEIDAAAKAQATLSLITAQTSAVQGDFANTADGAANAQRIQAARIENLKAKIGSALLPAWQSVLAVVGDKVLPLLERWLPRAFETLRDKIGPIVTTVREWVGQLVEFWNALRTGTGGEEETPLERLAIMLREKFLPIVETVASFIRENLRPVLIGLGVALGVLFGVWVVGALAAAAASLAAAAIPLLIALAIGALVAGFIIAYQKLEGFRAFVDGVVLWLRTNVPPAFEAIRLAIVTAWEWIRTNVLPVVAEVVGFIVEHFRTVVAFVQEIWPQVSEAIGHVLAVVRAVIERWVAFVRFMWDTFGENILAVARLVWTQIQNVIETARDVIMNVIRFFLAIINGDWDKAWEAIKDTVSTIWDGITSTIETAGALVEETIDGILNGIQAIWDTAWEAMKDVASGIWDGITDTARTVLNALLDHLEDGVNLAIGILNAALDGIDTAAGPLINFGSIPEIDLPRLERGGRLRPGQSAIVGDRGNDLRNAELFTAGPSGGRVWPHRILEDVLAMAGGNGGGDSPAAVFEAGAIDARGLTDPEEFADYLRRLLAWATAQRVKR